MLTQISPRLGRFNIVSNSFTISISNTPKEFSWTPEMPFGEIISQPRMFLQKFEGRITLEQLQGFANTHCGWHLNKQVDMVNSNMQFINFESVLVGGLPNKKLTVHSDKLKFKWVSGIFRFPDKMESILSEGMFKTLQIHFFSPKLTQEKIAHAKSDNLVSGAQQSLSHINGTQELNFMEGRIPPMFENMGILRQM
jgi:hypothetical protein